MAGKDSVIIHIDGDDTGYELSLKQIESKTKTSTNKLQSELKAINGVAVGVATAIGTIGAAVIGLGVKYNAEMEQYKAGFTTMLGSAEQADKTIASLKSFAEKTPFELTDLANASTTLLAFGEDVNELEADLKMLGDISLGNQEKFKGLALVFGQVQSQGKLMGQDLLQMINQGFNPLQVISEKTGESMASLKDKMSKGQISFEMVADAMRTATSAGGQFFNAMEAQSKTFTGQVSTLKDNVTSLFGEMSEDISQTLTEDVLPKAIEMVGDLKEAWEDGSLQKQIKGAAVAITSFGGAVAGVNIAVFANDIIQLVKGTKDFTAATKLGTTAQKLFNVELLKNPYTMIAVALGAVVAGVIAYDAATESATEKTKKIQDSVEELSTAHKETMNASNNAGEAFLVEASKVTSLKDSLYQMENQLKSGKLSQEEAEDIQKQFKRTASELETLIPGITSNLYSETGAIDIQKSSVDKLTGSYVKLAMAKATAAAYETKMSEIASRLLDAKELKEEAMENYTTIAHKEDVAGRPKDSEGFRSKEEADAFDAMTDAQTTVALIESDLQELADEAVEAQLKVSSLVEDTGDKISNSAVVTAGKINSAVTNTRETIEEEQDRLLRNLQFDHDMDKITDAEYYDKLEEFRDKYFKEGTADWQRYSVEIYNGRKAIAERTAEEAERAAKEAAEEAERAAKEARDKELRDLQYAHDMGEKSDEEYYRELATFRDKYFEKGSAEWQQYTKDIYGWQKSVLDMIQQDAQAAVEKFNQAKEQITSGLNDELSDTYRTISIQDGENHASYTELADIGAENVKLDEYNGMLDKLFERTGGELPDYVMQQLKSMDVDEGINYTSALLRATDEEFDAYINDINKKSGLHDAIADKLMPDEKEELANSLAEIYGTIPEGFFDIGEDSATEFAEGFGAQLETELKNIMDNMVLSLSSYASPMLSGLAGGNQYANNYYNNYYLQSSSESVLSQKTAIRNENTLNEMRGTN